MRWREWIIAVVRQFALDSAFHPMEEDLPFNPLPTEAEQFCFNTNTRRRSFGKQFPGMASRR
jgi:hypothetical protein